MQFYKGLKDDVKDDLYWEDIPDTFIKYIQYAVRIDNCLYIRRIEKRSQRLPVLKQTSGR